MNRRLAATVGIAALAVIPLAAGCGGAAQVSLRQASHPTATDPPLQTAYQVCRRLAGARFLSLGDNGHTMIVDTQSENGSVKALACVLADIGTSDAIVAEIDSTTALMGVRQDDGGRFHYEWSYHPDNGLNMVIKDNH